MKIGTQKPVEVLKQLESEIAEVKTTEEFTAYLSYVSKFHHYSFNNQMLIAMQLPIATRVAGYKTWQKMGRQVRSGEKSIKILAPRPYKKEVEKDGESETINGIYFAWVNVFDVSQTDGDTLPEYDIEIEGDSDFGDNLSTLCQEYGIKIEFTDTGSAYGVSSMGLVQIKGDSSQAMQVAVWIHEIGHEKLHGISERLELSKQQKEFEAECVAYIVCQHFDLPQNSAKYLATYGDYNLMDSLEQISNVAGDIISRLESTI